MNFDIIDEYYRKNPPGMILDDLAVKHIVEVAYPADYALNACDCGIVHPLESDTWYHAGLKIGENEGGSMISVYRACKTCRELLMRKLIPQANQD